MTPAARLEALTLALGERKVLELVRDGAALNASLTGAEKRLCGVRQKRRAIPGFDAWMKWALDQPMNPEAR